MILPANFKRDIQNRNAELIPLVAIGDMSVGGWLWDGNDDVNDFQEPIIRISTNEYTHLTSHAVPLAGKHPIHWKPLLLNIPSLNESIDLSTRKYKINNFTITISNYIYEGVRLSDLIADRSLINLDCRVWWASSSTTEVGITPGDSDFDVSAFQIYHGAIRKYEMDSDNIKLTIEDRSQSVFHKDMPIANVGAGEEVLDKYKNKPIPLVMGEVEKSPCVISSVTLYDTGEISSEDIILKLDKDGSDTEPTTSTNPLWAFTDKYVYLLAETEEIFEFDATIQYESGGNQITLKAELGLGAELSQDEEALPLNTIAQNLIIGFEEVTPINLVPRRIILSSGGTDQSGVLFARAYYTAGTIVNLDSGGGFAKGLYGTVFKETTGSSDWDGTSQVLVDNNGYGADDDFVPDDIWMQGNVGDTQRERSHFGFDIIFPISSSGYSRNKGWLDLYYKVYHRNKTDWGASSYFQLSRSLDWSVGNVHYSEINITSLNDGVAIWETATDDAGTEGIDGKLSFVVAFTDNSDYAIIALYTDIFDASVRHYMLLDDMLNIDYYVDATGRLNNPTAPQVINHILENELNQAGGVDPNLSSYSNWVYAFTLNEKINSKKFLEEFASASPYIPHFNNLGEFKFDVIMDRYEHGDIEASKRILKADCISWSFSRTKIEDVYTRIELQYNWDYAREEFRRAVDPTDVNDLNLPGYSMEYYNLDSDHSESTLIMDDIQGKYITSTGTAVRLVRWLVYWHCLQHLVVKLRLPLAYMEIEVGEIVSFEEILDIEPYGINYKWDAVNPDDTSEIGVRINGVQIFPIFMCVKTKKTMNYIDMELVQMHNLSDTPVLRGTIDGCTDENAWNYNQFATDDNGSCKYADDFTSDWCPFETNPTGEFGEDEDIADFSANYAENESDDVLYDENGVQLPNVFIIETADTAEDVIAEAKAYHQAGGENVQIYRYDKCEWEDSVYHKIEDIMVEVERSEDSFTTYGTSSFEDGVRIINIPVDLDFFDFYALNSGFNIKIQYHFEENDPTFKDESNFEHHYNNSAGSAVTEEYTYSTEDVYNSVSHVYIEELFFNLVPLMGGDWSVIGELPPVDCFYGLEITAGGDDYWEIPRPLVGEPPSFRITFGQVTGVPGDVNGDGAWNVVDVVLLANCILANSCGDSEHSANADVNSDGAWNVVDVVLLANCILDNSCGEI